MSIAIPLEESKDLVSSSSCLVRVHMMRLTPVTQLPSPSKYKHDDDDDDDDDNDDDDDDDDDDDGSNDNAYPKNRL